MLCSLLMIFSFRIFSIILPIIFDEYFSLSCFFREVGVSISSLRSVLTMYPLTHLVEPLKGDCFERDFMLVCLEVAFNAP